MSWETAAAEVEKLLHCLSPRFMLFVLILSGGLFFMPPAWAAYLSLDNWISAHRFWMGLGMVLSAAYLIPFGVSPIAEKAIAEHRAKGKIAHVMSNLAEDEKRFLRRFYFPRQISHLIVWRHEVGKLENDGVVFSPGDSGLSNMQEVHCLTNAALGYIEKHKELERTNPNLH